MRPASFGRTQRATSQSSAPQGFRSQGSVELVLLEVEVLVEAEVVEEVVELDEIVVDVGVMVELDDVVDGEDVVEVDVVVGGVHPAGSQRGMVVAT